MYTTQTCGKCGKLDKKIESSKVYKCKHCKKEIDRDINGARNILIRAITK